MSFHPAQFSIVHKDQQRDRTSFVGVRRDGTSTEFVLPAGFDKFPASDDELVSTYFFNLFRVLRIFRQHARDPDVDTDSDFGGKRGIQVSVKESEPAMLYSKIQILEDILERYDELRIYNVLYRDRRTDEVDYSQIHRYLDKAIYQNDTPYVEEMHLSRPVLEMRVTTLVRMFCFIYAEVALRTNYELSPEVEAEASYFKSQHLAPDSELFGAVDAHARTVDLLKMILDDIDREVAYKDEDYWYFFEAVETFLYGELDEDEEGISWGITRFAPVWEDMCMVWIREHQWDDVVYADSERYANTQIGGYDLFVDDTFEPPFVVELGGRKRFMRPDLVRRRQHSPESLFTIENESTMGVRVSVREDKKDETSRRILKGLRKRVEKGPGPGGVTTETKNQTWTYEFYGTSEKIIQKYIKREGRKEGLTKNALFKVVDFKCVPYTLYTNSVLMSKARKDERKQITYEYALQLSEKSETKSQLIVPTYFEKSSNDIGRAVGPEELHSKLNDQDISVLRSDFDKVMGQYLVYDHAIDWSPTNT